jgi:TIR domain
VSKFETDRDKMSPEMLQYALRHLPRHLLDAGRTDRYCHLFKEREFILQRLEVVSAGELVEDITRAKQLTTDEKDLREWYQPLEMAIESGMRAGIRNFLAGQFYSCFVSYSHADEEFAVQLNQVLESRGVRCWLDRKDILPGDDLYDEIDKGIQLWDKVLVCCSEDSLGKSTWVDREIDKALQKEESLRRERGTKVLALIPLDLDGYVLTWNSGKASMLRSRYIADFKNWKDNDKKFEQQIGLLIRALRADQGGRNSPPPGKL